jgi:hypothetical protein
MDMQKIKEINAYGVNIMLAIPDEYHEVVSAEIIKINEAIKQLLAEKDMEFEGFRGCERFLRQWIETYPEDIFTRTGSDIGVQFITKIREALDLLNSPITNN